MKLSLRGVYAAPRTLANGRVRIYYYHRATGARLSDDPTNPEFLEQVVALNRHVAQDPATGRARTRRSGRPAPVAAEAARPAAAGSPEVSVVRTDPARDPGAPAGRPQLPEGCFKRLFLRFQASTEFTDLAPSTRKEYGRHMRHVEPVLALHPVAAFTADAMDRLVAKFHRHPTLQKAIRRTMSVLLSFAVRILRWIPANPLLGVQKIRRRGRQEAGTRVPLTEPAIARFRAAVPYGTRARLVFELGLATALRREDLARVPGEVLEAGEIPLRTGKAGTLIVAGVTEHLLRAYRAFRTAHPEHAGSFFALGAQEDGAPAHKRTLSREFEAAAVTVGFGRNERLHALRYTAANRLCEPGMHYDDIAEVTGHAVAAMARHYCQRRTGAVRRGVMLTAFGEAPYRPGSPEASEAPHPLADPPRREPSGRRAAAFP